MADLDLETLERAVRWCAEAGRTTTAAALRIALAPLLWDELLALRALLADPPPIRPLGPYALADLARGAPTDVVAERERAGRYPRQTERPAVASATQGAPEPAPRRKKGGARRAEVVVRKPEAATPPAPTAPPRRPLLDELRAPQGRAHLERLVRRLGGRRGALVAALDASHQTASGGPVTGADLDALLETHGLLRGFRRREHDEVLHAVRAAGGVLAAAAARLGTDLAGLRDDLVRLDAAAAAEAVRTERRRELRSRATLAERSHLVLSDEPRLADLGLLEEFESDLKTRLPEHLRALRSGDAPLGFALARSLSLTGAQTRELMAKLGVEVTGGLDVSGVPDAAPGPRVVRRVSVVGPPTARPRPRPRAPARPPSPGATRDPDRSRARPAAGRQDPRRPAARPPTLGRKRPDRARGDPPRAGRPRPEKRPVRRGR